MIFIDHDNFIVVVLMIRKRTLSSASLTSHLFCRWFCHVDDDNYVILPGLLELLSSYSHTQDVYLGRPSLDHPIEAAERVKSDGSVSSAGPLTGKKEQV